MNVSFSISHGFVWFRVAKTGTRTLNQLLLQAVSDYQYTTAESCTQHQLDVIQGLISDGAFTFSMVRNPWSRLASAWENKIKRQRMIGKDGGRKALMRCTKLDRSIAAQTILEADFEWFVDRLAGSRLFEEDVHFRLQSNILRNVDLEYLGRFEQFEAHIAQILSHLDVRMPSKLPHKNKTSHSNESYRSYYNHRTRAIVAELYGEDIRRFDYSFS